MIKKKIAIIVKNKALAEVLKEELSSDENVISFDANAEYHLCLTDSDDLSVDNVVFLKIPLRIGEVLDKVSSFFLKQDNLDISDEINLNEFIFKPKIKLLKHGNNKVSLTEKETDMLLYLYGRQGKTVSREELLKHVWRHNVEINTRTLETHVYRLRQKIAEISNNISLIVTEDSGYSLLVVNN